MVACSAIDNTLERMSTVSIPNIINDKTAASNLITKGNCPEVEIVEELAGYSEFKTPQNTDESQLVSRAHLTNIGSTCTINERSMSVDLKLEFQGMAGPMAYVKSSDETNHAYPFFVAITAPNGDILAKEVFSASLAFPAGSGVKNFHETLRQIIPLNNPKQSTKYKILAGFQLNQEQLEYNRNILAQQKMLEAAAKQKQMQANQISTQAQPAAPFSANDPIVIQKVGTP